MKHIIRCFVALSLPGLLASSLSAAQGAPPTATGLLTSVAQLATRLPDPALVIIHAERDTAAGQGAQIPGSRFLPLSAFVVERNGLSNELPPLAHLDSVMESVGISTGSRIVIYGDHLAAARLFFTLDYLGLGGQASLLDGGLTAWRAANHPVSTTPPAHVAGILDPRVQSGILIETSELAARLREPNLVILDARPPAEFSGQVPGEGIMRAGHIPGARGFFWRTALTTEEPAHLKDAMELRRLLAETGLAPGKNVVTYCKTGVQASYLYFVLRYLGYTPRLYDGSYAEWSRGTERAVEP